MSPKESDSLSLGSHRFQQLLWCDGVSMVDPQPMLELWLAWFCAGNSRCCALMYVIAMPFPEVSFPQPSSPSPGSDMLSSSSMNFPSLGWREVGKMIQSKWALGVICPQYLDQLWVSALATTLCEKKLLWPKLRTEWIYAHKHKYLECSSTGQPLSRRVRCPPSPPWAYDLPSHGLWIRLTETGMKSILCRPHNQPKSGQLSP